MADNGILIPSLPSESALSAEDYLIIDDGTTTQKISVSGAYATASAPGLISTGLQYLAGQKFAGNGLSVYNAAGAPTFNFYRAPQGLATERQGAILVGQRTVNNKNVADRMYFRIFSPNTSGDSLELLEQYRLPAVDSARTANGTYDILTSKTPVSVEQGGTGQSSVSKQAWTPTFSYSDGSTAPTVANIDCAYVKFGRVLFCTGRFNITNLQAAGNKMLQFTLPTSIYSTSPGVAGRLYSSSLNNDTTNLLLRSAGGNIMQVIASSSGGYSRPYLSTGYFAFGFVAMATT